MKPEYNTLNINQQKAVFTNKKKVLVMSGAGAGKTKVLTNRICYLLEHGVLESQIVAFTFTNKAAREMKFRLNKMLERETTAFIGTFHSFCYSAIGYPENYYKLGFNNRPEIISDYEKSKIIKEILEKYNAKYSNIPFVQAISKIKNNVQVDDITEEDKLILNAVYHECQETLLRSSMIDYDDMIPLFIKLIQIDPYYKEVCQYQYVLVDECQDTNQIQYDLIKYVSGEYQNIFMVGDEDQLIYSFRSSDIAILKDFEAKADEIIILNENYRCNKNILNIANTLIEHNQGRLKKDLKSNIESDTKVEFNEFISQTEEAEACANNIKQLNKQGIKYEDIAILYRNNSQVYAVEKILAKEKIPYTIYGGKAFFEYSEIRTIIYTYRLLYNPYNEIAFSEIYNKPNTKIDVPELKQFINDYHKEQNDILTFASGYAYNPKIQELGYNLLMLKDELKSLSSEDFLMELLNYLKYNKYLKESYHQKPEYQRIMTLKDMITDLSPNEVEDFFNALMLEIKDTIKPKGVSLMTIHKSKGLEFDTVFVIGCNEGILPSFSKKGAELEEDRRVFYVAITRAKQRLYLYSSIVHYINGQIFKMKPSTFLLEAGIKEYKEDFFGHYSYNK